MNPESQFEKRESIEEQLQVLAETYLEESADSFKIDNAGAHQYSMHRLNAESANQDVLLYQPVKHRLDNQPQAVGPKEEIVRQIMDNALFALENDYPEMSWREAFSVARDAGGSFLITVEKTKLQNIA